MSTHATDMSPISITENRFTWIPFYEELADKLKNYRNRQVELVSFLEGLKQKGCVITPLLDQNAEGQVFTFQVMDPFTFFGVFNRDITVENRIKIARHIKNHFNLKSEVPQDFEGIPVLNNMNSWYFSYQYKRQPDDVDKLWDVFEAALEPNPLEQPAFLKALDRALTVRGNQAKQTIGLFWIRPNTFLSTDKKNRALLDFTKTKLTAESYIKFLATAKEQGISFAKLSTDAHQAFLENSAKTKSSSKHLPNDVQYWFVGAYWDDHEPRDQTARFIKESCWQNGYTDKHVDDVMSMQPGDKIAIKATYTKSKDLPFPSYGQTIACMEIKAVGTITQNMQDGRTVEVEWDHSFQPKEWYLYTHRGTIWKPKPDHPCAAKLCAFAFEQEPQDYDFFVDRYFKDEAKITETIEDDNLLETDAIAYSYSDALREGVFLDESELTQLISILGSKKNLILQGAPGVGKTFLAKKLAYLLMEARDDRRIEFIQFHQSYAYEDFIRGFRPNKDGQFELIDGPFYRFCKRAQADPDYQYVFIIDEINRGNLSQIFGELLMLIEADKRGSNWAMKLMYTKSEDEPYFFVPQNVHIIGMMNIADRSLALVDYALRRRFAFMTLEPAYTHQRFTQWMQEKQMPEPLISRIQDDLTRLNHSICEDRTLGRAFQIGHSYFCAKEMSYQHLDDAWYQRVIKSEIMPLLDEYWFDNPTQVCEWEKKLRNT